MINVDVKTSIKFPKEFIVKDDLKKIAETIIIPLTQYGIDNNKDVTGKRFPPLEASTIRKKAGTVTKRLFTKKGAIRSSASKSIESAGLSSFRVRPLIETGKLRRSFYAKTKNKNTVVIRLKDDRKEIGEYLQVDGVRYGKGRARKKHFKFFGITDGMEKSAMTYIRDKIKRIVRQHGGK